jgi:hypothetical protein
METSPIKKYLIYQTINNISILTPFSFIKVSNKFNKFYISIHDIDRPSKLYIKGISFSLFKKRLKINTEEYLKHSYVLTNLTDHVYGVAYIYNSVDNSIYKTDLSNIVNNLFNIKIKTNEFIKDKCTLTDILVIDKDHKYIYTSITL